MDKLKAIWKDSRERDFYLRWTVRVITLALVLYIALLKDKSTETIFVRPDNEANQIIIFEHIINEATKTDSLIQRKYHEVPDYTGVSSDSLYRHITKQLNR